MSAFLGTIRNGLIIYGNGIKHNFDGKVFEGAVVGENSCCTCISVCQDIYTMGH